MKLTLQQAQTIADKQYEIMARKKKSGAIAQRSEWVKTRAAFIMTNGPEPDDLRLLCAGAS